MYEVDDAMLHVLDELEDHPTLYIRKEVPCKVTDGPKQCEAGQQNKEEPKDDKETLLECNIYFLRNHKQDLLSLDFLEEYAHSKHDTYCPKNEREQYNFYHEVQESS